MTLFWREFLKNCESVSNVKIVCQDGIIFSHKIIVASVSKFLKNILLNIPFCDDVILFLPDFPKILVEDYLTIDGELNRKDLFFENISSTDDMMMQILKEESTEVNNGDFNKFPFKTEDFEDIDFVGDGNDGNDSVDFKMMKSEFSQMNELKDPKIRLGPNENNNKDLKIQKKIAHEQALAYYKSDKSISIREAAKMFNVNHTTLITLIKTGKSYTGRGRKSKLFSEEEEMSIVKKALQKVQTGEELSTKCIKELVQEEIEVIKSIDPERSSLKFDDWFVLNFAKRHDLRQYYSEAARNPSPNKKDISVIRAKKQNVQLNYSCEDLEKDLIPNPTTKKEEYKNSVTLKKIACEKALAYYKSDENISIRAAAKQFNVHHSTLLDLMKNGKSYTGRGKQSKVLTFDEEKMITNRAIEKVSNGQHFDLSVLRKIIDEEVEIIKINFPDRDLKLDDWFVRNFANRHELKRYFPEDNKIRNFECDICLKKFVLKNALVRHQKKVHYSFLQ